MKIDWINLIVWGTLAALTVTFWLWIVGMVL